MVAGETEEVFFSWAIKWRSWPHVSHGTFLIRGKILTPCPGETPAPSVDLDFPCRNLPHSWNYRVAFLSSLHTYASFGMRSVATLPWSSLEQDSAFTQLPRFIVAVATFQSWVKWSFALPNRRAVGWLSQLFFSKCFENPWMKVSW